jgi:NAD(P)H-hydrate epimerase
MPSLSVAQIREADRRCIQELGIPGPVLMNNAGAAVFRELRSGPVGVVCGKGNNGGDGFVVARLALVAGMETSVVLLAEESGISGDAALFMNAYRRLGGRVEVATGAGAIARAMSGLEKCGTLIDAILGTGVKGEVGGPASEAIARWPEGVYTVSVDVPSGLDADTGGVCGRCIRADVTVTFQFYKRGFDGPAARPYLGRVVVADIGIPPVCADDEAWRRLTSR